MNPQCKTCKHWQVTIMPVGGISQGECRKKAPSSACEIRWPIVWGDDWCSEHEKENEQ